MIKAIVIDDIDFMRATFIKKLQEHAKDVTVVAQANSVSSAIQQIKNYNPSVIFIDVELGDGTAFDVLNNIDAEKFKIVFVTAYDHYAVKAFRYSAIDYLVKPFEIQDLIDAIEKIRQEIKSSDLQIQYKSLVENINSGKSNPSIIILKTHQSIHKVLLTDIVRCQSENNYTYFYLNDGEKILVSNTLKKYEELLQDSFFFRTNQSHLINVNYIYKIEKSDTVILKDGTKIPLSAGKKKSLESVWGNK